MDFKYNDDERSNYFKGTTGERVGKAKRKGN